MAENSFSTIKDMINEKNIAFVDFKTLDLEGKLHHISIPVEQFTPALLEDGIGFDGSSYGFSKVENSDMVQIPDLSTAALDIFRERPTLTFFMTIHLTDAARTRFSQDVRYIALKAEQTLKELNIADTSLWGPEFEFNIFDTVEYGTDPHQTFFSILSHEEFTYNAYHVANPFDKYDDFRDEATLKMKQFSIPVKYHHHEVGHKGQQEIEMLFQSLLTCGDSAVLTKYILFNLAHKHDLHLTFMPKPLHNSAGNGWHVHQYLTKNGENVFFDSEQYGNISQIGQYYIGGLLKHAPALCAFTNASTNSFKRLGAFEAPSVQAFGKSNRSSAVRIPSYVKNPQKTRIEYRPPDFMGNPYLTLAAMLMAGIDGIVNQIDPRELGYGPHDVNFFDDAHMMEKISLLPRTLGEALDALEKDNEFLQRNNVFDLALIQNWIKIKRKEVREVEMRPHPLEYQMYFEM